MNVNQATGNFETWLGEQLVAQGGLDTVALKLKHKAMKGEGGHAFLRATFYRWAQLWLAPEFAAPKLLSVGDTHVENFGAWRDAEGRLVWGVNDFDEVCELPYTSDLVRLGVSARLAIKELKEFETSMTEACELVLRGYTEAIGGTLAPFVLAEDHADLTRLAQATVLAVPAEKFWKKKLKKTQPATGVPNAARKLLEDSLPEGSTQVEFREVEELLNSPNRCPDPTQTLRDGWIVRRLAPDAMKIELGDLASGHATQAEEEKLFKSMGAELAHLHAGSGQAREIMEGLSQRLGQNTAWFDSAWARSRISLPWPRVSPADDCRPSWPADRQLERPQERTRSAQ